jgi:hypothetical protein
MNVRIHATNKHSNLISVLRNTKLTLSGHSEQEAWNADIQCSAAYEKVRRHTAFRTRALLEHSNGSRLNTLLAALISLHATATCLLTKSWFRSHLFNSNEKLMEDVKIRLSSQEADFFDKAS